MGFFKSSDPKPDEVSDNAARDRDAEQARQVAKRIAPVHNRRADASDDSTDESGG